ncbi:spore cortex biosynthesis protein YabQ [Jeotgalibacillus soli]|uniref:Spore cortex biosynthesis protein YabQ n=1 Tax=Jeotgalibacillus soli TaxID=889306 RepID=A0A0C2VUE7_9BACL|nr:spore cortex biosynthesis protein YabQ [Jeotgalibacillus soli]KIL52522.1 hypothetical protein KP78_00570 [Jeotgalibacillus soli]
MILDAQLLVMASMIGAGLLIGFNLTLYDRYLSPRKSSNWRWITDGFFWCLQAIIVFLLLFQVNGGEWRLYVLISIICGFSAYQALIKRIIIRVLTLIEKIIKWVSRVLIITFTIVVVTPLRWGWRIFMLVMAGLLSLVCRLLSIFWWILSRPFAPFLSKIPNYRILIAKKVKKWLNLLYNR